MNRGGGQTDAPDAAAYGPRSSQRQGEGAYDHGKRAVTNSQSSILRSVDKKCAHDFFPTFPAVAPRQAAPTPGCDLASGDKKMLDPAVDRREFRSELQIPNWQCGIARQPVPPDKGAWRPSFEIV